MGIFSNEIFSISSLFSEAFSLKKAALESYCYYGFDGYLANYFF